MLQGDSQNVGEVLSEKLCCIDQLAGFKIDNNFSRTVFHTIPNFRCHGGIRCQIVGFGTAERLNGRCMLMLFDDISIFVQGVDIGAVELD